MQKRSQDSDDDKSCHQVGYKRRDQNAPDDQLWKGVCHQVASPTPLPWSTVLLAWTRHAAASALIGSFCAPFSLNSCAIARSLAASRLAIAARASSASAARGPSASRASFASQSRIIADWSKQESISARAPLSRAPPAERNCPIRDA